MEHLIVAAAGGDTEEVARILEENPDIDVNAQGDGRKSAFYRACAGGNAAVVALLLTHPDIDVNRKDQFGSTPFNQACYEGKGPCVRLLLHDPRVLVNEPEHDGNTPLKWLAYHNYIDLVKLWIATGRPLNFGHPGNQRTDPILNAQGRDDMISLLLAFQENPDRVRHEMRVELGQDDTVAAELFAMVVFHSDGLLQLKSTKGPAPRFFRIAHQLPMELQMLLCYRFTDSNKITIPGNEREYSFRNLAACLTLQTTSWTSQPHVPSGQIPHKSSERIPWILRALLAKISSRA